MKNLLLLLLVSSFYVVSASAQQLPSCKNPEIILSPNHIPCFKEPLVQGEFDIPELNIDFGNLENIFRETDRALLGAGSGGGTGGSGRTTPASTSAQQQQRTTSSPFSYRFEFQCRASLLVSAKKTIHYLLTKNFNMTHFSYQTYLSSYSWQKYYVTRELSHNPINKFEVPNSININLPSYEMKLSQRYDQLNIDLCSSNSVGKNGLEKSCVSSKTSIASDNFSSNFTTINKVNGKDLEVTMSLNIDCKK